MPDILTQEERNAIAAAERKGKVSRVETGTTGLSEWIWCSKTNKLVIKGTEHLEPGERRAVSLAEQKRLLSKAYRRRAPNETVKHRRERVRKLIREGKTGPEIAKEIGVPVSTIQSDAKALREKIGRARNA